MKLRLSQVYICDNSSSFNGKVCDLLIEEGVIIDIATSASSKITTPKGFKELVLKGKTISPAFVDMRADFCDPGFEHKETLSTGAGAALKGGFSDVALLPAKNPACDNKSSIQYIVNAAKNLPVKLHPYGAATINLEGEEMAELYDMQQSGAIGFTDGNKPLGNAGLLLRILQYNLIFKGLLLALPNEKTLSAGGNMHEGKVSTLLGLKGIPSLAEEAAIIRDLEVLKYAEAKMHFSCISSKGAVELIRKAKRQGLKVTCDVAVANLCFTDENLNSYDTNFKVVPPLRTKQDQKALWEGLQDGTIDAICSNHQPQAIEDKAVEFEYAAHGMITLPWMLPLLLQAKPLNFPLDSLLAAITHHPRSILGLPKTNIEKGGQATLVCFDTQTEFVVQNNPSKSANFPLFDTKLKGKIWWVFNHKTLYTQE